MTHEKDLLVLYSDGVTEARRPDTDQEFGEQRLTAVVQAKRNDPSASLVEAINAELLSFTQGTLPADDVTLVVARHFPDGGRAAPSRARDGRSCS